VSAEPQMLWVGSNGGQRLSGDLEQQAVDHSLVVIRNVADGCGQREDHVVVVHRKQIGLSGLQPAFGRVGLALGAMAVAAGVVGHLIVLAVRAAQNVSPQCRRAALFDG